MGGLHETRVDGRRVFAGRMISVEVDRVRFADGAEAVREVMHCFLADGLAPGAPGHADDDERIELLVVPWAEALAMIDGGAIRDAKSIAGLLLADRVLRRP
jgi:hypothetical protein